MSTPKASAQLKRRHRLQRLESPSRGFSGVVHVLGLFSFYNSFKFLVDNPNIINESFGWHLQYLTIVGISISTACFTCGLLADITNSHALFTTKNYLALVAAPIEIVISVLYWGLRAIDETLVIPPDLPKPPLGADFGFHLFPSILLSLDAILFSPPWPTSPTPPNVPLLTLLTTTAIAFLYWLWIELCYSHNGFYPYPIFALLSTPQRIVLFLASSLAMWGFGAGLRWMYCLVNGMEETPGLELAGTEGKGEKAD